MIFFEVNFLVFLFVLNVLFIDCKQNTHLNEPCEKNSDCSVSDPFAYCGFKNLKSVCLCWEGFQPTTNDDNNQQRCTPAIGKCNSTQYGLNEDQIETLDCPYGTYCTSKVIELNLKQIADNIEWKNFGVCLDVSKWNNQQINCTQCPLGYEFTKNGRECLKMFKCDGMSKEEQCRGDQVCRKLSDIDQHFCHCPTKTWLVDSERHCEPIQVNQKFCSNYEYICDNIPNAKYHESEKYLVECRCVDEFVAHNFECRKKEEKSRFSSSWLLGILGIGIILIVLLYCIVRFFKRKLQIHGAVRKISSKDEPSSETIPLTSTVINERTLYENRFDENLRRRGSKHSLPETNNENKKFYSQPLPIKEETTDEINAQKFFSFNNN